MATTQDTTTSPNFSKMTRKQLAALLTESSINLGIYRRSEQELCTRVWLRSDKPYLVLAATQQFASGYFTV